MKANELRIGNYVQLTKAWYELNKELNKTPQLIIVNDINRDHIYTEEFYYISGYKPDHLEGIPLTEGWLLRFGGKEDEGGDTYLPMPKGVDMRLYMNYDHLLECKGQVCPITEYDHIKYVHQLQNLYFALTGEELKYE